MSALQRPPDGVTVTETLGEVEVVLPRPPAKAPLLSQSLQLVVLVALIGLFFNQLPYAEHYAEALRYVLGLATDLPTIGAVAAKIAANDALLWLTAGAVAFSMFSSLYETGTQLAASLSKGAAALLWPPAVPRLRLTAHQLVLMGEPTPLHDLQRPQDASAFDALLEAQEPAVRDWVIEVITEARQQAVPSSAADIPEAIQSLRQRRAASAAERGAQAQQRHQERR